MVAGVWLPLSLISPGFYGAEVEVEAYLSWRFTLYL